MFYISTGIAATAVAFLLLKRLLQNDVVDFLSPLYIDVTEANSMLLR